jgi:hypothetical protein
MSQISEAMRLRLMSNKRALTTGNIVKKKDWTSGKMRFLPLDELGDDLGIEYHSFWCDRLKKGATALKTHGFNCPLSDYFESLRASSKADREAARKAVNSNTEWWMPMVNLSMPSDVPRIQIFCAPQAVYLSAINRILDVEIGENVVALEDGRTAYVKKEGVNKETKWTVDWLDAGPVYADEDMMAQLVDALSRFSLKSQVYLVDKQAYCELYQELTGEDPAPETWEQPGIEDVLTSEESAEERPRASVGVPVRRSAAPAPKAPVKPPVKPPVKAPVAPAPKATVKPPVKAPVAPAPKAPVKPVVKAPVKPAAEPEADPNAVVVGKSVIFENENVQVSAKVLKLNDDGTADVEDTESNVWAIPVDELVVVLDDPTDGGEGEGEATDGEAAAEEQSQSEPEPEQVPVTTKKANVPVKPAKPATSALRAQVRK